MPIGFDSIRAGAAGSAADAYEIDYSCRFFASSSSYLTYTPSSASSSTDRRKVTHSFWVKRGTLGIYATLYSANKGGSDYYLYQFMTNNKLRIILDVDDSNFGYITTAQYADSSAWYHFCLIIDTTQGTTANRVKFYVNGVLQDKTTAYGNDVSQNFSTYVMDGSEDEVGRFAWIDGAYFDGYLADAVLTIGQNNTIGEFGEFHSDTGEWVPIDLSGLTFGTNGFHLDFANASSLGNDISGNNNDWTSSGMTTSNRTTITPTS